VSDARNVNFFKEPILAQCVSTLFLCFIH